MLILRKVAVTGELASGKTKVCKIFEELGAFVVSSDEIVHDILSNHRKVRERIVDLLGKDVTDKDGNLERREIARKVFKSNLLLQKLESIIHPLVWSFLDDLYSKIFLKNQYDFFVVEIPLLYEVGWNDFYDDIVYVFADESLRKERFEKLGFSNREFYLRSQRFWDEERKKKKASFVIENNDDIKKLYQSAKTIFKKLRR